jgi:hypothetical protein
MHHRNLLLIAMAWAAAVLLLMLLPIGLDKTDVAGILYFPAIVLAMALSGSGEHAPTASAMWSAAIAWSLTYWWLVMIFYALLLEYYLLRRAVRQLLRAHAQTAVGLAPTDPARHLEAFGQALDGLERRRRSHWVLAASSGVDLGQAPVDLASAALGGGAPAPGAGPFGPSLAPDGTHADPGGATGTGSTAVPDREPPKLAGTLLRHLRRGLGSRMDGATADAVLAAMQQEARRRQGRAG